MRTLRRVRRHVLLSLAVLLAAPIFVLNLWVMQKGVASKVFQADRLRLSFAVLAWAALAAYLLARVKRAGFWSFCGLAATMLGGNLFYLVATKNYALGFFALFLVIVSGLYGIQVFQSLSEVYYRAGKRWYEGHPRYIPGVTAEIRAVARKTPARLSRLGGEGCYAFPREADALDAASSVELKLGDLSLECAVELITKSKDGLGGGFRFRGRSADQEKDIRDFIDRVRSSGYVS